MTRSTAWLIAIGAFLLGAILLTRSCARDTVEEASDQATTSAPAQSEPAAADNAAADAARAELRKQQGLAMYQAVSTLQSYLAAVGAQDWAKADPYWANDTPAASGEADLRRLDKLRALRIENGNPKPLDSEPIPNAIEVPVELRASIEGESQRRYRGWYRMRRAVADGSWEITSASVDAAVR